MGTISDGRMPASGPEDEAGGTTSDDPGIMKGPKKLEESGADDG